MFVVLFEKSEFFCNKSIFFSCHFTKKRGGNSQHSQEDNICICHKTFTQYTDILNEKYNATTWNICMYLFTYYAAQSVAHKFRLT
jgi:hypothetical protein